MLSSIKINLRYIWPLHFILLLTNWLPDNVFFMRLRGKLVRPFLKKCGKRIGLGRNITLNESWRMEFGNDVYIALGCWLNGEIVIEDEVMLGPYCILSPTDHTRENGSFRFGSPTEGRICLRKGSWVGTHSTIVSGGILGQGSVLGANSVLNFETDDHSLYAGTPARILKRLTDK